MRGALADWLTVAEGDAAVKAVAGQDKRGEIKEK